MAQKLSVEIALEGGAAFQRQLAELGKEGAKAFNDIKKSADQIGGFQKLDPKDIEARFKKFGVTGKDAIDKINKAVASAVGLERIVLNVRRAEAAFKSLGVAAVAAGSKFAAIGAAFGRVEGATTRMVRNLALIGGAVGLAGAGFFALVKGAADAADNLQETAAGVGIAAQSFQALANAAADSGVAPEKLAQSMGILSKAITESAAPALKEAQDQLGRFASDESIGRLASSIEATSKAAGTAKGPIAQLGISVFDAIGRLKGTDQILLEIADAFQTMADGPQKTAIALQLFGRAGRGMIDFLNKGSAGIKEFAATMAAVGFTDEQLTMGDKFARQMLVLTTALTGVKNQIGIAFAPSVGGLIEAFTNRIIGNFTEFKARLANVMQGAIEPIINDLTRVVQGADPQTEFGAAFIQSLNAVAETARQTGQIIVAVFLGLRAAASGVATVMNSVFGTNISGDALLAAAAVLKFTGALGLISASASLAMSSLRALVGVFQLVASAARAAAAAMATSFGIALAPILAPVIAFLAAFLVVWLATTDEAKQIWADLWEWVKTIPAKAFNAVIGSVNLFKQNLIDAFTKFEITTLTIPAPKVEPPDTKPTETRLGRFIAFLKDKFNAPIEELKKLFPGIFAEAKNPLNNLEGAFASVGDAGADAGKEAAKGLEEAQRAAQQVEQQARQALKSIDDGIRGTTDSIEQLKQQQSFLAQAGGEGSQEFQANELKLKQLQRQKRAQLEARREQERANQQARENAAQDIQRALEKQSVERQAFQQRLRELDEIEKRQRAGGGPTPSPFLPLAQQGQPPAGAEQEKAQGLDALKGKADAAKQSISQLGQAMGGLQAIFDQAVQGINAAFGSIDLVEKFNPIIEAARAAVEQIKQAFTFDLGQSITLDFGNIISNAFTAAQSVSSAFQNVDISSVLSAQIDALISKFNELASAAARAASAASSIGSGEPSAPEPEGEFAHGGLLGGRGTGTSDSNLAWVSRGEHIMPARAVRQPGVLSFLEALRRSGGNLRAVLDDMGRFALGGMVPRAMPAFAAGGLNGGTSNVTIQFPGLPPISGLRASSDVVDQLHKAAALAQVRSGGRKPSRYS